MATSVLLFHHSFDGRHNGLGHGVDFDVAEPSILSSTKGRQPKRFRNQVDVELVLLHLSNG